MRIHLAVLLLLAVSQTFAEETLFEFGANTDLLKFPVSDAKLSIANNALSVETGHKEPWPGITLKAPGGKWDLSKCTELKTEIKNTGAAEITLYWRIDNPGADGMKNCITLQLPVKPGATQEFKVPFKRRVGNFEDAKRFGMMGMPAEMGGNALDYGQITQMIFFFANPGEDHQFSIGAIRAGGSYEPPDPNAPKKPFLPFIDTFGQFIHHDWPGKTHSLDELSQKRADEEKELAAKPAPDDWDAYGGWKAGPEVEKTGFFYPLKHDGKWWLVDPDGHLFWSHGIDCVGSYGGTPTEERGDWFADLPGNNAEFDKFRSKDRALLGHYAGRTVNAFNFAGANLKRKYGAEWHAAALDLAHKRLRSWGMNTIGNWSDSNIYLKRKTPYTVAMGSGGNPLAGSEGSWGKFVDVFDPAFKDSLGKSMSYEKDKTAGDPWCLGYFVDNELSWGDEISLSLATLKSPASQPAKTVFIDDLKTKYGEIAKLNEAWGTRIASWDAMLNEPIAPDRKNKAVYADLAAFYTKFAEQYFKTCREAVKAAAPKNLYLGCRFAAVNHLAAQAAAKYCDVVSYNLYRRSIADFKFNGNADVPLLVGEWHLGALDRGMFHPGLVPVTDQAERAAVYREYVTSALNHPQFVGCHWFQYLDEATTGRPWDGENYQIGFIDICDTPYTETVGAARDVGYRLYEMRAGKPETHKSK